MIIHPDLEKDSTFITELTLSQLRLHNNAKFPWLILIPRKEEARELVDLSEEERITIMQEISVVSKVMQELFKPDKLNVASLGNIVPQLHIHVIARFHFDEAWPAPVWGSGFFSEYYDEQKTKRIMEIKQALLAY